MKLMSNDYHRHHHYCWLCCFWKDRWVATFIITAVHCSCPPSSPPSTFGQWCQCILPWGQTPPQQEHEHRIDLASCLSADDFLLCRWLWWWCWWLWSWLHESKSPSYMIGIHEDQFLGMSRIWKESKILLLIIDNFLITENTQLLNISDSKQSSAPKTLSWW